MNNDISSLTINDYLNHSPNPDRKSGERTWHQSSREFPLVSVCTLVRNGEKTLAQTIDSVKCQTYPNIEYIIIDGASTDGTLEIIDQHSDHISYWVSEKDLGAVDGANKAISYAQGEFIFFISSDDWADPNLIKHAIETQKNTGADFVFGNTSYYTDDMLEFTQKGDSNYATKICYLMPRINTPSMVMKKECYKQIGLYNLRYKIAPDYEWVLRLHIYGGVGVYDSRININHRLGGISTSNLSAVLNEVRHVSIQHGCSRSRAMWVYVISYSRTRLRQISKKLLPPLIYNFMMKFIRRDYS